MNDLKLLVPFNEYKISYIILSLFLFENSISILIINMISIV